MTMRWWLLCAAVLIVTIGGMVRAARGHDGYQNWYAPDNPKVSCCNDSDCRPTRAYLHEDGLWRAWNGAKWLIVPPGKVLPTDLKGDGRNHLCEKGDWIYCFSPTSAKG
jgi:hypothetical protein